MKRVGVSGEMILSGVRNFGGVDDPAVVRQGCDRPVITVIIRRRVVQFGVILAGRGRCRGSCVVVSRQVRGFRSSHLRRVHHASLRMKSITINSRCRRLLGERGANSILSRFILNFLIRALASFREQIEEIDFNLLVLCSLKLKLCTTRGNRCVSSILDRKIGFLTRAFRKAN